MEEKMSYKKDMTKREGKYISLAWFTGYNRPMCEFFIDDEKPMVEAIELRILDLCETAADIEVRIIEDCDEQIIFSKTKPFASVISKDIKNKCEVCSEESTQMALLKEKKDGIDDVYIFRCAKHLLTQEHLNQPQSIFESIKNV